MDNYSPGLVTHHVAPSSSSSSAAALIAQHQQGLERAYVGASPVAHAPCRQCQQWESLSNLQPHSHHSSTHSFQSVIDSRDPANQLSTTHNMSGVETMSPLCTNSPPHMTRGRMDSDTLPGVMYSRTRNSSVYSTTSAFSTVTTNTTISDIVDMYHNVVMNSPLNKSRQTKLSGTQPYSPRAYRNTLLPLLQHRFSFGFPDPSHERLPAPDELESSSTANKLGDSHLAKRNTEGLSIYTPASPDPSYGLDNHRAQINSPISLVHNASQSSSGSNPCMPRTTPISPAQNHPNDGRYPARFAHRYASPDWISDYEIVPQPLNVGRRETFHGHQDYSSIISRTAGLEQSLPGADVPRGSYTEATSRRGRQMNRPKSPVLQRSARQPIMQPTYNQAADDGLSASSIDSQRSYSLSRQASSTGVRRSRSRLQKRDRRTLEEKANHARASVARRSASTQYPKRRTSWSDFRRTSMKAGAVELARRLSIKSTGKSRVPPLPQQPMRHPAVPLSHYQIHGPKAFEEEFKQELKDEKKRAKEELKLEKARRSFEKKNISNHQRTASGRSTSSIGSVFEGWKHNLTRSASERRREKLKASIVVVGPTTLTAETNAFAGMI